DAVDRGGRRHWVAEDLVPLAEDEVARDHERPPLVAFREQREEHVGLGGVLLDVAEVVELCGAPHNSTNGETSIMWSEGRRPTISRGFLFSDSTLLRCLTGLGAIRGWRHL